MIPRRRLWNNAAWSSGSCHSESSGSDHHHWRLNPCRTLLDRLPLNEIAIAIVSGTRDQTRYAHVTVCRILGLRHGSRHQRCGSYGDDGRTGGCGPRDRPLRHVGLRRSARAPQVIEHRHDQQHHQDDHERGHLPALTGRAVRLVDQVPDHGGPGRSRQKVVRVVVAEHRQGDDDHSRKDARLGQGQRHAPERAEGAASQVASRLQQAGVDAIEEAEQGQDHVGDVPVHQTHDHGERSALEPPDRVVHDVDEHEEPVDVPVVVQQVDPGEHPHQVADPERGDQQDEQQALVPAAEAGHVVRDRIAQNETDGARHDHVDEGVHVHRLEDPEDLAQRLPEVLAAPPPGLVHGQGTSEDRVDGAERDRDDGVEGEYEQDQEPKDPGEGERRPIPSWILDALAGDAVRPATRTPGGLASFLHRRRIPPRRRATGRRRRV